MATRAPVHQDQPRGGINQKKVHAEGRNRTALGDIGNLVVAPAVQGKPQIQINRPITRRFGAQLLANAQAAADNSKKQGEQAVNNNNKPRVNKAGLGAPKPGVPQKLQTKKLKPDKTTSTTTTVVASATNPETVKVVKEEGSKKRGPSFTSVLSARSKEACGVPNKAENLVVNIDEADAENELAVVEYVEDIYQFYKLTEGESQVRDYMASQTDINERMRSILVDWLIEVHFKFELRPETLYLTINIVDRFLSVKSVPRKELQLVGMGALLIASKYEEIWATEVNDLVCISDRAYTREQVCAMEKAILGKLEWLLTLPTPYMFLPRFIKASYPSDTETENMAFFFAELGILNYAITISYCPSMLAASSVYAARCTLNKCPSWTETLKHYTGYTEDQLRSCCAKLLVNLHSLAPENKLKAAFKKFSKPDFDSVALRSPAKSFLA